MAFTRHGHHIPGSEYIDRPYLSVMRCGGPVLCRTCAHDVAVYNNEFKETKLVVTESDILAPILEHIHSVRGRCECGEYIGSNPAIIAKHVAEMIYKALPEEIRG